MSKATEYDWTWVPGHWTTREGAKRGRRAEMFLPLEMTPEEEEMEAVLAQMFQQDLWTWEDAR